MIRLAVRVTREQAELVLADLLELAPAGVEEVELGDGVVEYAVYGPPGEVPSLPDLRAAAGDALVDVSSSEVADGWEERWRQFHRPLMLGHELAVRPPWSPPTDAEVEVVIDPGRAFGTGSHATTRMCLQLMLELEATASFVDVGCGSGVLAIAAASLGWRPVLALDNDEAAVQACRENAAANGTAVEVRRFDLRTEVLPNGHEFQTMAANLLGPLLQTLAGRLADPVPRTVIASGLLVDEMARVGEAFAARGLSPVRELRDGDWAALLLVGE